MTAPNRPGEPNRLRVAVRRFEPFETAIAELFASWDPPDGAHVELDLVSLDVLDLHQQLLTDGGLSDGAFDIAFLVTDWLPQAIEEGHLLNLQSRVVALIPDHDSVWPASLRAFQQTRDGIYGIPYHDGPECLVYRRDLFEDEENRAGFRRETGRELEVPRTWDEYLEVARFLSDPEAGRHGTVVAAYPDAHNTVYDFCLQVWSRGGEITGADGRPTLDTPQAQAGLDWYRALVADPGLTHPDATQIDSVRSGEIFAAGDVAIMQNWFGFAANAQVAPDSAVRDKVSVAPVPAGPGGSVTSFLVYWVLAIGAGCPQPDLAFDFVRHATSADADILTTLRGGIGCRRSTWTDPAVLEHIPFFDQMAELHAIARTLPGDPKVAALAAIIDDVVAQALATTTPSAELLARAQVGASALYEGRSA